MQQRYIVSPHINKAHSHNLNMNSAHMVSMIFIFCVWFNRFILLIAYVTVPHPSGMLFSDDYNWICDKLRPHAHMWNGIARSLGFRAAELKNIEADPRNNMNAPFSYLYAMLDSWLQWAPGDDRGSRDYATVRSLSTAVDKAGLGLLAQDLMSEWKKK